MKIIALFIIVILFLFLSSIYLIYVSLRKKAFDTEPLIDRIILNSFLGSVMIISGYILFHMIFLFI